RRTRRAARPSRSESIGKPCGRQLAYGGYTRRQQGRLSLRTLSPKAAARKTGRATTARELVRGGGTANGLQRPTVVRALTAGRAAGRRHRFAPHRTLLVRQPCVLPSGAKRPVDVSPVFDRWHALPS